MIREVDPPMSKLQAPVPPHGPIFMHLDDTLKYLLSSMLKVKQGSAMASCRPRLGWRWRIDKAEGEERLLDAGEWEIRWIISY